MSGCGSGSDRSPRFSIMTRARPLLKLSRTAVMRGSATRGLSAKPPGRTVGGVGGNGCGCETCSGATFGFATFRRFRRQCLISHPFSSQYLSTGIQRPAAFNALIHHRRPSCLLTRRRCTEPFRFRRRRFLRRSCVLRCFMESGLTGKPRRTRHRRLSSGVIVPVSLSSSSTISPK